MVKLTYHAYKINFTYVDLIEHRKAAHVIAWANARAQYLKVLRTRAQPAGIPRTETGF